jgi:hypothetical protein
VPLVLALRVKVQLTRSTHHWATSALSLPYTDALRSLSQARQSLGTAQRAGAAEMHGTGYEMRHRAPFIAPTHQSAPSGHYRRHIVLVSILRHGVTPLKHISHLLLGTVHRSKALLDHTSTKCRRSMS